MITEFNTNRVPYRIDMNLICRGPHMFQEEILVGNQPQIERGMKNSEGYSKDVYYRLAKKQGYRARSVYKLIHIDKEFDVLGKVSNVIDLCAAPGSWSQYVVERLSKKGGNPKIVSVDVQDISGIDGAVCIKEDITSNYCVERILEIFKGRDAELVLCDGAPEITGLCDVDECLQVELLIYALSLSLQVCLPGSSFIGKCFVGELTSYVVSHFKKFYQNVILLKPKASRHSSAECFIYSTGLRDSEVDPMVLDTDTECDGIQLIPCGYDSGMKVTYEMQ